MAKMLDHFLGVEDDAAPAPEPEVAAPAEPEQREPPAKPEPDAAAAKPEPKPEPKPDPEPEDVTGLKSALLATRKERADHKGRAERLEGELAEIRKQLAEAAKPASPAPSAPSPPPAPVAIPNPAEDPDGYHRYTQGALLNERMNLSEAMLRDKLGDADVDAKIEVFKRAMAANPALRQELNQQPHPWAWAYKQAQRFMAMDEIGPDPAAFRSKVEAELRAKWEAEMAGTAPAAAPADPGANLVRSIGTQRSAAPRAAAVVNIPESFDDILAPIRNRYKKS